MCQHADLRAESGRDSDIFLAHECAFIKEHFYHTGKFLPKTFLFDKKSLYASFAQTHKDFKSKLI